MIKKHSLNSARLFPIRKVTTVFLAASSILVFVGCSSGKSAIAQNQDLERILGSGAAGAGSRHLETEQPPNLQSEPNQSSVAESVTYYKLISGKSVYPSTAGKYTVAQADSNVTVQAYDKGGVMTASVSIQKETPESQGQNTAAFIEVPEGGKLIASGGSCMAQLVE